MSNFLKNRIITEIDVQLKNQIDNTMKLVIVPIFNNCNELTYFEFYLQS